MEVKEVVVEVMVMVKRKERRLGGEIATFEPSDIYILNLSIYVEASLVWPNWRASISF